LHQVGTSRHFHIWCTVTHTSNSRCLLHVAQIYKFMCMCVCMCVCVCVCVCVMVLSNFLRLYYWVTHAINEKFLPRKPEDCDWHNLNTYLLAYSSFVIHVYCYQLKEIINQHGTNFSLLIYNLTWLYLRAILRDYIRTVRWLSRLENIPTVLMLSLKMDVKP